MRQPTSQFSTYRVLFNRFEQAKITSIIAETGVHFSLGLKYNSETESFEWSSGEEWTYSHWAAGEPDLTWHEGNSTEGWCAYMHRHDDIGYWRVVSCDDTFSYICEFPRQGYTEPPTTTTTAPPEMFCPSSYSHQYEGHCYEYFGPAEQQYQVGWDFAEGREFCQTRYNGDLVSIGDGDEEGGVGGGEGDAVDTLVVLKSRHLTSPVSVSELIFYNYGNGESSTLIKDQ